ncbi:MAG: hypothetical protein U1E56_01805 [Bauldia sp.]
MSALRPRAVLATALVGMLAFGGGYVVAAQPHMQSALGALQGARAQLVDATADKAGHRIKAIALVDDAIREVRLGIVAGAF